MEPKQKEESLDTKIGSEDASIWTRHCILFYLDFVFHLTMYQWHLTKRYSNTNNHVLWLGQIQSPWLIGLPSYILLTALM